MDGNLMQNWAVQQQQALIRQQQERQKSAAIFKPLASASGLYALVYVVCLYRNPSGILSPVWTVAAIAYVACVCRIFGAEPKRDGRFAASVMVLLGVSNFLTGNRTMIFWNDAAIFLLLVALLMHNFAQDRQWDVGTYLAQIIVSVCGAVSCIAKPFSDGMAFRRTGQRNGRGRAGYIAVGILIAVPSVLLVGALLVTADLVFADLVEQAFSAIRIPSRVFGVFLMFAFGFFSSYCGVRYVQEHAPAVVVPDRRKGEPLIAITATGSVALLYLAFCMVQIGYLFLGNLALPHGVTYAEYARQGFFQLLFVCVLNLIVVLAVRKYFRESRLLNVILLVICGCTFIMTASSAFRMLLYIRAYQLTFLRVSVLVALAAIALWMAGVVVMIVRPGFPLFRYGLGVACVVYLLFSFSHVDYFIASYNLNHARLGEASSAEARGTAVDYGYIYRLSTDAAPAIAGYLREHPGAVPDYTGWEERFAEGSAEWSVESWVEEYLVRNYRDMTKIGLRDFNVSHYAAYRLFSR